MVAVFCCTALLPSQESQAERCYAAHRSPNVIVCYRNSWKAEYRHGNVVYVPILIQVPTPAHPSSVTIVDSLDDIRPSAG
ncbi:hypothetical protein [Streptomyces sp. NPDC001076]